MIRELVLAELRHRPGRAALLLLGYALGVAVMVVLLSVGQAMLAQARDEALLGGGDLIIVPRGIGPEMLRSGGTSSLFLGLDQARFIQRQVLESPRGREEKGIAAASPILDGHLVRFSRPGGETIQAIATGEIPERAAATGGAVALVSGSWHDSEADRRWVSPRPTELYHEIDAFHLPYGTAVGDSTWAEWHYFNITLDEDRWIYLSYMIGGRVGEAGEWGGRLLLTVRSAGGLHTSISETFADTLVHFDTTTADVTIGPANTVRQTDGRYHIRARLDSGEIDLIVQPAPNRIFPPSELGSGELISGYVVPALGGTASGRVCLTMVEPAICEDVRGAPAYHDHNWGVWRDVSWDWGAAFDGSLSLLYGAVHPPDGSDPGIFAYLVDDAGVIGVYRAEAITRSGEVPVLVGEETVSTPSRLSFEDPRRGLAVEIAITDRHVTDMERDVARYFVQMRGTAMVRRPGAPQQRIPGSFEIYID